MRGEEDGEKDGHGTQAYKEKHQMGLDKVCVLLPCRFLPVR